MRCNFIGLLQIATFFSNNLDFFTSSGYSPRGGTLTLNPLQAENMLANKKKAAAYIQAITKVCNRLTDWLVHSAHWDYTHVFVKNSILQIKVHYTLWFCCFVLSAQATVGSIQRSPVKPSYTYQLHWEQRGSDSTGVKLDPFSSSEFNSVYESKQGRNSRGKVENLSTCFVFDVGK